MRGKRRRNFAAGLVVFALVATACGGDDGGGDGGAADAADCESVDEVTLQLQWFIQAQFGGYFAAQDQGFYADQCLDVTIVEGGVDIVPAAAAGRRCGRLRDRLGAEGPDHARSRARTS